MKFNDIAKGWVDAGCKLVEANKDNSKMYIHGVQTAMNTMLETFAEVPVINWHPYPDEKPQRNGLYLITVDGQNRTETGFWFEDEGYWSNAEAVQIGCDDWLAYEVVTAWAEFPEPYKEADR